MDEDLYQIAISSVPMLCIGVLHVPHSVVKRFRTEQPSNIEVYENVGN